MATFAVVDAPVEQVAYAVDAIRCVDPPAVTLAIVPIIFPYHPTIEEPTNPLPTLGEEGCEVTPITTCSVVTVTIGTMVEL